MQDRNGDKPQDGGGYEEEPGLRGAPARVAEQLHDGVCRTGGAVGACGFCGKEAGASLSRACMSVLLCRGTRSALWL